MDSLDGADLGSGQVDGLVVRDAGLVVEAGRYAFASSGDFHFAYVRHQIRVWPSDRATRQNPTREHRSKSAVKSIALRGKTQRQKVGGHHGHDAADAHGGT